MNRYLLFLLVLALLIVPAFAGDLIPPINEDTPVFIEKPLPVLVDVVYTEKLTKTTTIIDVFLELIGWKQTSVEVVKNEITVEISGATVAIIPNDSPFRDMNVHEYCLRYQYGTKNWRECELELVSV